MRILGAALDRARHDAQIVAQLFRQLGQIGEMECRSLKISGSREFDDPWCIDMRQGIFPVEVELRRSWMIGLGTGCLQHRQIEFEPVVGRQRRLDPSRAQKLGLPERGDDTGLLHVRTPE
ncbi:hypothetical protein RFN28_28855 [Mesorhizobium sp. VK24D]|uniref:Uncharacterized protein n=1 Tax=Mesorhizobium album TaxID=3072314 RepID=A0ABU4Y937_9HYPH|nr:hypothetical protein [Mesorhizobium sp. VK24D]MDX8482439.1 hypothetical protein [Mesorhizobium sp. VK24D]